MKLCHFDKTVKRHLYEAMRGQLLFLFIFKVLFMKYEFKKVEVYLYFQVNNKYLEMTKERFKWLCETRKLV